MIKALIQVVIRVQQRDAFTELKNELKMPVAVAALAIVATLTVVAMGLTSFIFLKDDKIEQKEKTEEEKKRDQEIRIRCLMNYCIR